MASERGQSALIAFKRSHDSRMRVVDDLKSAVQDGARSSRDWKHIKRLKGEAQRKAGVVSRQIARIKEEKKMKTLHQFLDESEEINELSKKTLGSYIQKAGDDMAYAHHRRMSTAKARDDLSRAKNDASHDANKGRALPSSHSGGFGSDPDAELLHKREEDHLRRSAKRHDGIKKAVGRLTRESTEVNEISKDLAHRYLRGAAESGQRHSQRQGENETERRAAHDNIDAGNRNWAGGDAASKMRDNVNTYYGKKIDRHTKKAWNRLKGTHQAVDKLAGTAKVPAK